LRSGKLKGCELVTLYNTCLTCCLLVQLKSQQKSSDGLEVVDAAKAKGIARIR